MRKVTLVVLVLILSLGGASMAFAKGPRVNTQGAIVDTFQFGDLGQLDVPAVGPRRLGSLGVSGAAREPWRDGAESFARGYVTSLGAAGSESFASRRVVEDELGQVHVRIDQSIAGLRVVGADMIVHADARTGKVIGVNGRFVADRGLPRQARVAANAAIEYAAGDFGIEASLVTGIPELTYVVAEDDSIHLAWTNLVSYTNEEGEQLDRIFADALTGAGVARHPQIMRAKNRQTYTCNNGTSLPGTLLFNEGGSSADLTAMAAYNNAGKTYDYYFTKHGRDSYNNAGATLRSSVHYSSSYNNAFWNGSQMVYGDGDGVTFSPLAKSLDVVAHELTHAVTGVTAGLVYSNESGALNEAMSDCFGAAVEAYSDGSVNADVWKVGDEIYTPGTPGDALRTMNDPAAAGDFDYYPTRYVGTADNGGVHTNSGIQNLAFYLLVSGGTHPRGKTSQVVTGIGMAAAEKIFYRALDVYATSSTNFRIMRNYTVQAAGDLYGAGSANQTQTGNAWTAVGNLWTTNTGTIATVGATATLAQFTTTSTGRLTGHLFGPGTDYDLYLQKLSGATWSNVASGTTASTNEVVQYNGTAGTYRWRVTAFAGTGAYTLYTNR
jgi:Zn-dependent metalloprotease